MAAYMQRIRLALSTGLIFYLFSEQMFWGKCKFTLSALQDYTITWLTYSVVAYIILAIISYFRVNSLPALFLVGASYGWILEGIVVNTMYDNLPLSISFTGLAWHAIITVMLGWFALGKALLAPKLIMTVRYALLAGTLWGLWSVWWWVNENKITPLENFIWYTAIVYLLLVVGIAITSSSRLKEFAISRTEAIIIGVVLVLYFAIVTIPQDWRALVVLIPLMAVTIFTLNRNRKSEKNEGLINPLQGKIPVIRYVILLLMPIIAVLIYYFLLGINVVFGFKLYSGWGYYAVLTTAGFIAWGWSVYRMFRKSTS